MAQEMKQYETGSAQKLLTQIENAFSDFEEPPNLSDWQRLAACGYTRINLVPTLAAKLTPKNIKTWETLAHACRGKINAHLRLLTTCIQNNQIELTKLTHFARFSGMDYIMKPCGVVKQSFQDLLAQVNKVHKAFTDSFQVYQNQSAYIYQAVMSCIDDPNSASILF